MKEDLALRRLESFGIDTYGLQQLDDVPTSTSIVRTRADGSRPALHVKGATGHFTVPQDRFDAVTDARVFHLVGVDAMEDPQNAAQMRHA